MLLATPCAYRLPDVCRIEEVLQRDGSSLWAIRRQFGDCMNKSGEWEDEPQPSERHDEFFARCRFATPEEAYKVWETAPDPMD